MAKTSTKTAAELATIEAEKAARFKDVAGKRLEKALDAISLIGNCSVKASYSYTPEQVAKIGDHLKAEVMKVMKAFEGTGEAKAPRIEL